MGSIDDYINLAKINARHVRPRRKEELNPALPYFQIVKTPLDKYDIKGYNFETHDNAPRMLLFEAYMKRNILPNINARTCNISGFYNIELHDSYTYLGAPPGTYDGCFTFSKFVTDDGPALLPDPYAMQNWGGALPAIKDPTPWKDKSNKVCFFGTTTGPRTPQDNHRINLCLWSLKHPDIFDFKITKIAQMTPQAVRAYLKEDYDSVVAPRHVTLEEQMKYKYHLAVDGNTCRFDIWNYLTNSVTLKYESTEMLWYYPLMVSGEDFITVNKDTIEDAMKIDEKQADAIISSAKRKYSKIATPVTHMLYATTLFEALAQNAP